MPGSYCQQIDEVLLDDAVDPEAGAQQLRDARMASRFLDHTEQTGVDDRRRAAAVQHDSNAHKFMLAWQYETRRRVACVRPGRGAAEIPKGTHVLLRMMNSISTRTAAEGNQVYLQTATPVAVEQPHCGSAGDVCAGSVSHSKRSGRVKGRAELGIRLETMTFADGKMVKISPRLE